MQQILQLGQFWSHDVTTDVFSSDYLILAPSEKDDVNAAVRYQYNDTKQKFTIKTINNANLKKGQTYYLDFIIDRLSTVQSLAIFLTTEGEVPSPLEDQYIKYINIDPFNPDWKQTENQGKAYSFADKQNVNFLFTPNEDYDNIVIELRTNNKDQHFNINLKRLAKIKDILASHILPGNPSVLIKFAVQSQPGLVMNINNEEIHVGRSGVYEMCYPIPVSKLGFVIPKIEQTSTEPFLDKAGFVIDYQY